MRAPTNGEERGVGSVIAPTGGTRWTYDKETGDGDRPFLQLAALF
jgi:hypothetical protein